jgi:hypothetical protein
MIATCYQKWCPEKASVPQKYQATNSGTLLSRLCLSHQNHRFRHAKCLPG